MDNAVDFVHYKDFVKIKLQFVEKKTEYAPPSIKLPPLNKPPPPLTEMIQLVSRQFKIMRMQPQYEG